ncbi:2-dehydro-3-deoxygalactonokinase, partial [Salmonella enterica subsp. enterica serovar Virginia]|nr:2-dehydro-3-deoxygalactonokinase [Salmonella enterica subsp. enterica serovar Virginia]
AVFHNAHQPPRSVREYQAVSKRAQTGDPNPWKKAFSAHSRAKLNSPAVLPSLFEVRASHVLGHLAREQVSDFLSGLLIGAEVAS